MLHWGGGLAGQNVPLPKVVFKIHFKPFCVTLEKKLRLKMGGTPILSHFSPILAILKIFTSVLTFLGGQTQCNNCDKFFEGFPYKFMNPSLQRTRKTSLVSRHIPPRIQRCFLLRPLLYFLDKYLYFSE